MDKAVTFCSKNRTTHIYWSTPSIFILNEDWTLILNDWINRRLYLLRIPHRSISPMELVVRSDRIQMIDLQIINDDPEFTDKKSGYKFRKFLVDTVEY